MTLKSGLDVALCLFLQQPHYDDPGASDEIAKLTILHKCRKCAAEEELPLRQIFDNVCRTSGAGSQEVAFHGNRELYVQASTYGNAKSEGGASSWPSCYH